MGYAFISYSSKNQQTVDSINNLLRKKGIKTWMAPGDIPAGSRYAQVITSAIKGCSCVVLLLSKESQESVWVANEIERAINYQKIIIPVQIDESILNDEFEFYLSSQQIVAVRKVDESSNEIKKLIESAFLATKEDGQKLDDLESENKKTEDKKPEDKKPVDNTRKNLPISFNTLPGRQYIHAKTTKRPDLPYNEGPIMINENDTSYWVLTTVMNTCTDETEIAEDVKLSISINKISDYDSEVVSRIICPNARKSITEQSIHFKSDRKFSLSYQPGTAYLYSQYYGLYGERGIKLSEDIMSDAGAQLGFWEIDGRIPSGKSNGVTVSIQVNVI